MILTEIVGFSVRLGLFIPCNRYPKIFCSSYFVWSILFIQVIISNAMNLSFNRKMKSVSISCYRIKYAKLINIWKVTKTYIEWYQRVGIKLAILFRRSRNGHKFEISMYRPFLQVHNDTLLHWSSMQKHNVLTWSWINYEVLFISWT